MAAIYRLQHLQVAVHCGSKIFFFASRSLTVTRHVIPASIFLAVIVHQFTMPLPIFASESVENTAKTVYPAFIEESIPDAVEVEILPVEIPLSESKLETHTLLQGMAGYRFLSFNGYAKRAAQYEDLHSGMTFGGVHSILGKDHKFALEGVFLSDNDYHGDLTYDYMGAYRFHMRTESLYHNLDNFQVFAPSAPLGSSTYLTDRRDQGVLYGIRTEQDLATMRIRMGNYPAHINLGYWRMVKEGSRQLRFADHAFEPTGSTNSVYSQLRPLDRVTHEGKLGLDTHIGPVDLIYDFTVRQFTDHAGAPRDLFSQNRPYTIFPVSYVRPPGSYQHDDTPDSRFIAHTVKLHTDQTGGIVAAGSYTYGQRTNLTSVSDVVGVNGLSTTLHTAAGDLIYTPCKEFSLAVRFRHQEIERDAPSALIYTPATPSSISILPPLNSSKDVLTTVLSIRPVNSFTVKGEYSGEISHRDNVQSWDPASKVAGMILPEDTVTHRGTLTLLSRPLKGLRLKARYSYTTTDSPSYGTSADERHDGQLLVSYTLKDLWGVTGNYQNSLERNDSKSIATLSTYSPSQSYQLPREKRAMNATLTLWGNVLKRLTLAGSAGLLRTSTDQEVLFSGITPGSTSASNYTSQAFLYSLSASYRPIDKLTLSLMFQQLRSFAEFDPAFLQYSTESTLGVKEISRLKTVENAITMNADYEIHKNISCGVAYTYRKYADQYDSLFNGSLHSVIANLAAKW